MLGVYKTWNKKNSKEKAKKSLAKTVTLNSSLAVKKKLQINIKLIKNLNAFTKISLLKSLLKKNLSQINLPILTAEQSQLCEGPIIESELLNVLESMSKSPGNDGFTK